MAAFLWVLHPARVVANRFALLGVAVSLALQLTAMYLDPLARVLRVAPLRLGELAIVLGLAAIPALTGQLWKLLRAQNQRAVV